ncbi:MAG: HD domain-containing protein [Sedimentisphaerales bacterium]
MDSSQDSGSGKLIVDSIHGDIHLTQREVDVIDTPSFQRLRHLKQLAMAQMVYPSATHTRFAHSIGALKTMLRILEAAKKNKVVLSDEQRENLRLAALLHDIGHYPYSHLMEKLDRVKLTEEFVGESEHPRKRIDARKSAYPEHEEVGEHIVTCQKDLLKAIGGKTRAKTVTDIFTRATTADPQLSKLIRSSLDIDRLDYLLRDSQATGVPYGNIDINYLLNNLKISPQRFIGFLEKTLPAVEHSLLARFFIYRVVYYHKTIYGMEEACRQMLRRLRDKHAEKYHIPPDGKAVTERVTSNHLYEFTDTFVDNIIQKAVYHEGDEDENKVIRALARSIQSRRPPKLLKEVQVCEEPVKRPNNGTVFLERCKNGLKKLSEEFNIPLGQFIICDPKITIMEPPRKYKSSEIISQNTHEFRARAHKEEEEEIWIFKDGKDEPESFWDIEYSLVGKFAKYYVQLFRLYVVYEGDNEDKVINKLRTRIKDW